MTLLFQQIVIKKKAVCAVSILCQSFIPFHNCVIIYDISHPCSLVFGLLQSPPGSTATFFMLTHVGDELDPARNALVEVLHKSNKIKSSAFRENLGKTGVELGEDSLMKLLKVSGRQHYITCYGNFKNSN